MRARPTKYHTRQKLPRRKLAESVPEFSTPTTAASFSLPVILDEPSSTRAEPWYDLRQCDGAEGGGGRAIITPPPVKVG